VFVQGDVGRTYEIESSPRLVPAAWTPAGSLTLTNGIQQAALAIGEDAEATRTRHFLLDLEPTNHFELRRD
jgi:hypothetical protein